MNKWVTVKKASELTGYTEYAIRSKIIRGDWVEGTLHRKAPDNRQLINLDAFDVWVEGGIQKLITNN